MLLNVSQKYFCGLLSEFGALKKEQAEKLLLMKNQYFTYKQTVNPLICRGLVREKDGCILDREGEVNEDIIISFDVMLKLEDKSLEVIQKGKSPFTVTFFRFKKEKLWRYDICIVKQGFERVVSAMLEGMNSKYRVIIFVLENPDQQKDLYVSCEYCFVWKKQGEYHFYKEKRFGDEIRTN